MVQEALTNILKHAQATQVSLIVERHGGEVRAIIEDDGQGFDRDAVSEAPDAARKMGLKGMQERATQASGQLDIETAPGKGTPSMCAFRFLLKANERDANENSRLARNTS
jgi:two-component system CheB/CheR fusion protein